ncbi:tRNA nucleotidyltransferase/poly(A) polymerase family protein [Bacteriovorax sp. BAL6_X]|uniref:tRNA nucleotidyltransferase/poly(A) polymerase n=1 Tax=Bacteriovorax sp. BAL6_X TaxID=1201290 RepID=UPI0003865F9A|nr:tRNA nucleotidyltransferase/poly(A) polymerase [Bacteriovorax sp. BAL6_X]EPZ50780.1 tRNA nucleotidyltransferase/poly(A) polymerase family protein [Bacteriovorax sp. BAL6_X]
MIKKYDLANIPNSIQLFIRKSWEKGFRLCLVGGNVRDWYLGKQSTDFDFEIRHLQKIEGEAWIDYLTENFPEANYIGMGVFRIKLGEAEIEFSSPRLEEFNDEIGHKNFTPKFSSILSYEQSFKRRDIRINAIGAQFSVVDDRIEIDIIDPFGGLADIENKKINYINADFFNDPVRLLRTIRFSINTGFVINEDENFSKFDLRKISSHYLKYESSKCNDCQQFVETFVSLVKRHHIKLPQALSEIVHLDENYFINDMNSIEEVVMYNNAGFSEELYAFFAIKKNQYKKVLNFINARNALLKKDLIELRINFINAMAGLGNDSRLKHYDLFIKLKDKLSMHRSKDSRNKAIKAIAESELGKKLLNK